MSSKRETLRRARVMMAFIDGRKIESRFRVYDRFNLECAPNAGDWHDDTAPQWNWEANDYRVKPDVVVPVEVEINVFRNSAAELSMLPVVVSGERELMRRLGVGQQMILKLREVTDGE